MKTLLERLLPALMLAAAMQAQAGRACEQRVVTPQAMQEASKTALRTYEALEARDQPVALVARVGTSVAKYGLTYSHAGFAVRDHANGRWTVVHLLNECGSDRSGLYAQGLVNFFADDLINQDARIVWFEPGFAQRLAGLLASDAPQRLHQPHYSVIARPDSRRYQSSTGWLLEMLAAARLPQGAEQRRVAQELARADGHEPDRIHIPYSQRVLGGLFSANVAFTDHPVGTRLSGNYPVVTVRSILRYLHRIEVVAAEREWRNGREARVPGPA